MDKAEFLRQEYITLRAEIAAAKGRIHRLAWLAILLPPSALYLSSTLGSLPVTLGVPLVFVAASLLFLSEHLALMRCGRYVKVYIEHGIEGVVGWEHWLETRDPAMPRNVDRYVAYFFHFLFVSAYVAGAVLAVDALRARYTLPTPAAGAVFYILAGAAYLWFLFRNLRLSVSTGMEDVCLKALLIRPHCIFGPESD